MKTAYQKHQELMDRYPGLRDAYRLITTLGQPEEQQTEPEPEPDYTQVEEQITDEEAR